MRTNIFTIATTCHQRCNFQAKQIRHNTIAKGNNLLKEKDPQITGDDVREGRFPGPEQSYK